MPPSLFEYRLIAVVVRLVGTINGDTEILALSVREGGELDVELSQMGPSDLLIKFLGENVDTKREVLGPRPESNLGKDLIGEGARHDE